MRAFLWALALASLSVAGSVQAAEIKVVAPGFIYNSALKELAADFTRQTGVQVVVGEVGMNVALQRIKDDPPDVVGLPSDLMNTLMLDGGIVRESYTPLGRDELVRILTEPECSLVRQYRALLETESFRVAASS